jgi:hypothetical protein
MAVFSGILEVFVTYKFILFMVAGSKGAENLTRHTNLPVLNFKFCFTF